jgi:hypothetical protein
LIQSIVILQYDGRELDGLDAPFHCIFEEPLPVKFTALGCGIQQNRLPIILALHVAAQTAAKMRTIIEWRN